MKNETLRTDSEMSTENTHEESADGYLVLESKAWDIWAVSSLECKERPHDTIKSTKCKLVPCFRSAGGLTMDTKRQSIAANKMAFVDKIGEMSRRGDIPAVVETFEGFWTDKAKYPWHTVYPSLEKRMPAKKPDADLSSTLLLLRDAVFGALGLTSLSLALDLSTEEVVKKITKQQSWREAQRIVRQYVSDIVTEMIGKGDIAYLIPFGLVTDGLGFLVPLLRQAQLQEFRDARPKLVRGKINLKALSKSTMGRTLLKQLAITEDGLKELDPRGAALLESYEHMLVDIEIGEEVTTATVPDTEQVTIGGEPLKKSPSRSPTRAAGSRGSGVQTNLTAYVGAPRDGTGSKNMSRARRPKSKLEKSRTKRQTPLSDDSQ